jgi:hypothetical protein
MSISDKVALIGLGVRTEHGSNACNIPQKHPQG